MNEQEVAKYRKKKNNSSRSEKKADHKHEYKDCIISYTYNWADRYFAHRGQYCVACGKINGHRSTIDRFSIYSDYRDVGSDESGLREKYPELPVFHLRSYLDDYVNLQEAQTSVFEDIKRGLEQAIEYETKGE